MLNFLGSYEHTYLVLAMSFTASRASKASTWATDPASEIPSTESNILAPCCSAVSSFTRN